MSEGEWEQELDTILAKLDATKELGYLSSFAETLRVAALNTQVRGEVELAKRLEYERELLSLIIPRPWDSKLNPRQIGPVAIREDGTVWPDLPTLPAERTEIVIKRLSSAANLQLRTQYAEILWFYTGRYEYALEAFRLNLQTAKTPSPSNRPVLRSFYLCRALVIACLLNDPALKSEAEAEVRAQLKEAVKGADERLILNIAGTVAKNRKMLSVSLVAETADASRIQADKHLRGQNEAGYRDCVERLRELQSLTNKDKLLKRLERLRAKSFVREGSRAAANGETGLAAICYQRARQCLLQAGYGRQDVVMKRLQLLEHQQNQASVTQMGGLSHQVQAEPNNHRRQIDGLRGESIDGVVAFVANIDFVPDVDQIWASTKKDRQKYPLQFLITITPMTSDGRVVHVADSDEEKLEYWVGQRYDFELLHNGLRLAQLIADIKDDMSVTSRDIVRYLAGQPSFEGMDLRVIEASIQQIWDGQLELAVPALALQFEAVLRNILRIAGQPTIVTNQYGQQHHKNIDQLLGEPVILKILGNDLVYLLRHLLSGPFGPQWRHAAAHGYWSIESSNETVGSLLIYAMLRLAGVSV